MAWKPGKRGLSITDAEANAVGKEVVPGTTLDIPLTVGIHKVTCQGTFTELYNDETNQVINLWSLSKGDLKWDSLLPWDKRALNIAGKEISISVEPPLGGKGRKQVSLVTSPTAINPPMNTESPEKAAKRASLVAAGLSGAVLEAALA